jgi:Rrf2 family protein
MHFSQCHDLAVHGLCCLAAQPDGRLVAAKSLADVLNAKLTYFAKVLQSLAHAGLVRSERGKLGGYGLNRPASQISLADILNALEGDREAYRCPRNRGCEAPGRCAIQAAFGRASKAMLEELAHVTLADVVADLRGTSGPGRARWLSSVER